MIEYLTTHDLCWINNVITGKVNPFNYITLEAVMAAQYQYGDSRNVPAQAGSLLQKFLATSPFADGNRRTALIATLTFLNANGYATKVSDAEAAQVFQAAERNELSFQEAINRLVAPAQTPLPAGIPLRKLITHECNLHTDALQILSAND